MPRALRIEYPGAIYHVMNRGDRREPIFRDDVEMDCKGIAHGNVDSCGKPVEKMRRTKMPQTNNPNSDLCKYSGLTPLRFCVLGRGVMLQWFAVAILFFAMIEQPKADDATKWNEQNAASKEASKFLRDLETSSPDAVNRDKQGNCVSLRLMGTNVNPHAFSLISQCQSISHIYIYNGKSAVLTASGIESLSSATNLNALDFMCGGELPPGVFEAATKLCKLRFIAFRSAYPSKQDFALLPRLTDLEELVLVSVPTFSDNETRILKQLGHLRKVRLEWTGVSEAEGRRLINSMGLANIEFKFWDWSKK